MSRYSKTELAILLAEAKATIAAMRVRETSPIKGPKDAAAAIRAAIGEAGGVQEHFVALVLNSRSKITASRVISIGSVDHLDVHPRDVFWFAISANAAAVIVGHCHPSGDVEPSDADVSLTQILVDAGRILGIPVLDHVIVSCAHDQSHSMRAHGTIPMPRWSWGL